MELYSCTVRPSSVRLGTLGLLLVIVASVQSTGKAHVFHVDHSDDEIRSMDIETLLHIENDFRQQNAVVDKRVASIHGRMTKLRIKQNDLEMKYKKVGSAKDWEVRQKETKARELERAKAELEAKWKQIQLLAGQGEKLRLDITSIEDKMKSLSREDRMLEREYEHPSLRSIVLNEAERMGPVRQHLLNKTVQSVFPQLRLGLREAEEIQSRLRHSSAMASLFASLCVYVLGISLLCVTYRCIKTIYRVLTLPRLLFTVDMAFMVIWALVLVCYAIIQQDPLWVMATKHVALTICIQVIVMSSLIGNVLLRCLFISVKIRTGSFVELFWTIIIAQHYYQAVWVSFLLDTRFKSTSLTYFGYLMVNAGLAVYRARAIGRPTGVDTQSHGHDRSRLNRHGVWMQHKLKYLVGRCEDFLTTGLRQTKSKVAIVDDEGESEVDDFSSQKRGSIWGYRGFRSLSSQKRVGTLV